MWWMDDKRMMGSQFLAVAAVYCCRNYYPFPYLNGLIELLDMLKI